MASYLKTSAWQSQMLMNTVYLLLTFGWRCSQCLNWHLMWQQDYFFCWIVKSVTRGNSYVWWCAYIAVSFDFSWSNVLSNLLWTWSLTFFNQHLQTFFILITLFLNVFNVFLNFNLNYICLCCCFIVLMIQQFCMTLFKTSEHQPAITYFIFCIICCIKCISQINCACNTVVQLNADVTMKMKTMLSRLQLGVFYITFYIIIMGWCLTTDTSGGHARWS